MQVFVEILIRFFWNYGKAEMIAGSQIECNLQKLPEMLRGITKIGTRKGEKGWLIASKMTPPPRGVGACPKATGPQARRVPGRHLRPPAADDVARGPALVCFSPKFCKFK